MSKLELDESKSSVEPGGPAKGESFTSPSLTGIQRVPVGSVGPEAGLPLSSARIVKEKERLAELPGLPEPLYVRRVDGADGNYLWSVCATQSETLEAARQAGFTEVGIVVLGDLGADEVYEIARALYQTKWTATEKADLIRRSVEALQKDVQVGHPGGKQPHDRGINRAAQALRLTRHEVRRALKIGSIHEVVTDEIKKQGLDDNQSALLAVAKQTEPDEQIDALHKVVTDRAQKAAGRKRRKDLAQVAVQVTEGVDEGTLHKPWLASEEQDKLSLALEAWRRSDIPAILADAEVSVLRRFVLEAFKCFQSLPPIEELRQHATSVTSRTEGSE